MKKYSIVIHDLRNEVGCIAAEIFHAVYSRIKGNKDDSRAVQKDGKIWIQITMKELSDELSMNVKQCSKGIEKLVESDFLKKEHSKSNKFDRTYYYTLDNRGIEMIKQYMSKE